MTILMISLDKKILDAKSSVAQRIVGYGAENRMAIIIPFTEEKIVNLSPNVTAYGSGGKNKFCQFWKMYNAAKSLMKQEKFDLITTQDPFFTGLIGVWLKNHSKKILPLVGGGEPACHRLELRRVAGREGVSLEVQLHGDFFGSNYYSNGNIKNRILYLLSRYYIVSRADQFRVVGERVKRSLVSMEVNDKLVVVRPVSIDSKKIEMHIPRFNLHERYSNYKKIFLTLGRLEPVKNLAWLINIFQEVVKERPDYLLLIVGDGSERSKLEALVKEYNLDSNIKLEGWTDDPLSYLKTADTLLFPSLSEGYGLVAMEAIAAHRPVIMNDVGVANFEVKATDKVKIIPILNSNAWVRTICEL